MPTSSWPAPFPFPPPIDRSWSAKESQYLEQIVREWFGIESKLQAADHYAIDSLIKRLATPRGVQRFEVAARYARDKNQATLSYTEWLEHVLEGFQRYHPQIIAQQETPEGPAPALQPTLVRFATSNYHKIFKRHPSPDALDDLIARVLLSLQEDYFFDVALEPWLWQTTRNLVLNDIRREHKGHTIALDEIAEPYFSVAPGDFVQTHIRNDLLCKAIKNIHNQRYRIVLQLIYVYRLNNTELATFFGVSVPRATTWLSRARSALKDQIQPHQLFG
jgi:RNA polymerase sigma factor (sigma-70 family)